MKILNANFLWEHFMLTPFKVVEKRFNISRLVCATKLTKYTTYEKVHWVVLKLNLRCIFLNLTSFAYFTLPLFSLHFDCL